MRDMILLTVDDLVTNFVYYDRKEDEELSVEQLENSVLNNEISIDEIVERFKSRLLESFNK